jgi:hypothetical protein
LLQRQHVADLAKRIEKEVTVAQFGPGHPVFCLSSLNCHYGSAQAVNVVPAGTSSCCLPSSM